MSGATGIVGAISVMDEELVVEVQPGQPRVRRTGEEGDATPFFGTLGTLGQVTLPPLGFPALGGGSMPGDRVILGELTWR